MEIDSIKSIAKLESDIEYIKNAVMKIEGIVIEQNDMRKELSMFIREHAEIKEKQSGFSERITALEEKINGFSAKIKIQIFDYVLKFAGLALGGWIVIIITNFLSKVLGD